jgi:hypothetical protein
MPKPYPELVARSKPKDSETEKRGVINKQDSEEESVDKTASEDAPAAPEVSVTPSSDDDYAEDILKSAAADLLDDEDEDIES